MNAVSIGVIILHTQLYGDLFHKPWHKDSPWTNQYNSWEPKGIPQMPPPPRNKALLKDY